MKLRRDIYQAIADPTRRAILALLATHTLTAGTIASNFDAARPTISKHLQILNECDLIEADRQGREIFYKIKIDKIKEIDLWLEQFRKVWEARFEELDKIVINLKSEENET